MACLEHECMDCGEFWMDNDPRGICPECGSTDVHTDFDEEGP
jgi:Zn finger protein HypA/HybF involved in hydrogenase expression